MNNSYITIIKEKRTALSRKRIPLNQNGCTANFRIGVPFGQNLHIICFYCMLYYLKCMECRFFINYITEVVEDDKKNSIKKF